MSVLEQYAYSNRLRFVHPGEKILFALATLIFLLGTSQTKVYLLVLVVMSGLLIGMAGIPIAFYLRLLLLPLSFLITSGAGIALTVTLSSSKEFLFSLSLGKLTLGVTQAGLLAAFQICLKALASVSCLYFLALTTPMVEITNVLCRLRVPGLWIDLLTLVYRFSSVLLDTATKMHISQSSRLGYSSLSRSFRSLGYLISNLFLKTYEQARMLNITLSSRGYQGEFRVLEPSFRLSQRNLILIGLWLIGLGALAWLGGGA
ncbi:cobalt/nickel transport system permease protein [Thermanaeromonas toyohensis ToBE]|uniref:Cobalt/nickel transport system permease protein n=1 Tax=Thermanaeromonas toyohensis ToBE TaxID=698762 RepID=A0A1W1VY15_9FIRM|nr:cobalt ECF transporter T component CbiQ [Thermanaeromonas toyohensis]SMB98267.1 cobalt/nickel transport system permease protein [Thermanaeromonas toyohensis ToBE]